MFGISRRAYIFKICCRLYQQLRDNPVDKMNKGLIDQAYGLYRNLQQVHHRSSPR